jgi:hypothetical protein
MPEWVPVGERPPDDGEMVWAYVQEEFENPFVEIALYDTRYDTQDGLAFYDYATTAGEWGSQWTWIEHVTHWMPIEEPEPPLVESKPDA